MMMIVVSTTQFKAQLMNKKLRALADDDMWHRGHALKSQSIDMGSIFCHRVVYVRMLL